jgi:hypothetical protein
MRAAALAISGMVPLDFETSPQGRQLWKDPRESRPLATSLASATPQAAAPEPATDSALLYLSVPIHAIMKGTKWGIPRTARSSLLYPKLNATFD